MKPGDKVKMYIQGYEDTLIIDQEVSVPNQVNTSKQRDSDAKKTYISTK